MSSPVYLDSIPPTWLSGSPLEQAKKSQLQLEITVLKNYNNLTGENNSIAKQLSSLEKQLHTDASLDSIASQLNQAIVEINANAEANKAPFPSFSFTTESNPFHAAIQKFAITLEKFLNCAAEKGKMNWTLEQKCFQDLTQMINFSGEMSHTDAFKQLNGIIERVNEELDSHYQLPTLQFERGE